MCALEVPAAVPAVLCGGAVIVCVDRSVEINKVIGRSLPVAAVEVFDLIGRGRPVGARIVYHNIRDLARALADVVTLKARVLPDDRDRRGLCVRRRNGVSGAVCDLIRPCLPSLLPEEEPGAVCRHVDVLEGPEGDEPLFCALRAVLGEVRAADRDACRLPVGIVADPGVMLCHEVAHAAVAGVAVVRDLKSSVFVRERLKKAAERRDAVAGCQKLEIRKIREQARIIDLVINIIP